MRFGNADIAFPETHIVIITDISSVLPWQLHIFLVFY